MSCRETAAGRALTRIARQTSGLLDVQVLSLVHAARRDFTTRHGRPRPATPAERETLIRHLSLQRFTVEQNLNRDYTPAEQARVIGHLDDAITHAERSPELTNADVHVWTTIEQEAVRNNNALRLFFLGQAARRGVPADDMTEVYTAAMDAYARQRTGRRRTEPLALSEFGELAPMVEQAPGDYRTRAVLHSIMQYGTQRCPACGQFMAAVGNDHGCPETVFPDPGPTAPPAPEQSAEDPFIGGVLNRGRQPNPPTSGDDEDVAGAIIEQVGPEQARPSRINTRIYRSADNSITLRMESAGGLRLAIPNDGDSRDITITANTADGNTVTGTFTLLNTLEQVRRGGREIPGREGRWRNVYTQLHTARTLRCTCPTYQANYYCEHVRDVRQEVATTLNGDSRPATPPVEAVATAREALAEEYEESLTMLNNAPPTVPVTDAPNPATPTDYLANPEEFLNAANEARDRAAAGDFTLPYQTENVLGPESGPGGPRTFGLELEIDFPNESYDEMGESKARLAEALAEAGLTQYAHALPWHYLGRARDSRGREMGGEYSTDPNAWAVEFDRSVDEYDGRRGCEVKSPIMSDTPQTWENVRRVCEIIQAHGGTVTMRTGLHVNVGTGDFDHTIGHYNRVAQISSVYDDVIVRMASSGEKGNGAHRGRAYCAPVIAPSEGFHSISELQEAQGYDADEQHRRAVNFAHVPREGRRVRNSTRVEMRIFDGTVDPGRIQAAVRLSVGIVNAAAAGRGPGMDPEPAGTHRARNRVQANTPEADSESARRLIDLVASTPEAKTQLAQMWGQSPWSPR